MRFIYLGCGLLLYSFPTFAEQLSENNHPIYQINTLIMTATAKKEQVHDAVASADVIGGKSLRQRYVNDLSDALNDRIGVDTIGVGLNRKGISIRGMSTEHTLFLVDGQRINSSSSAIKHSDAELNWVPAEAIEQIEALGGVVNVITRKPTKINPRHVE